MSPFTMLGQQAVSSDGAPKIERGDSTPYELCRSQPRVPRSRGTAARTSARCDGGWRGSSGAVTERVDIAPPSAYDAWLKTKGVPPLSSPSSTKSITRGGCTNTAASTTTARTQTLARCRWPNLYASGW